MRVRRYDRGVPISRPGESRKDAATATKTSEGFIRVSGRLMRDGALTYSDGKHEWGEYRSREEIEKSLPSFKNAVLTLDHPKGMVSIDNVRELQRGQVGSALGWDPQLPDHILADSILVTGKDAIAAIERGVADLSIGFTAIVERSEGTDAAGRPYKFIQRDIEGNHVAIVEEGRAGHDARLLLDTKSFAADSVVKSAVSGRLARRDAPMDEVEVEIGGKKYLVPAAMAALWAKSQQPEQPDKDGEQQPAKPPQQPGQAPPQNPQQPQPNPAQPQPQQTQRQLSASSDDATALRARVDVLEAELGDLRADRQARRVDDLRIQAARLGVRLDAKCVDEASIMRACVVAKRPAMAAKLDANKANPAYLPAAFDQLLVDAAQEPSHRVTNAVHAAIADGANRQPIKDWLLEEKEAN